MRSSIPPPVRKLAICSLAALVLGGCAAPTRYYQNGTLRQAPLRADEHEALVYQVGRALGGPVRRLELETPDGRFLIFPAEPGSPPLASLPTVALRAAFFALDRQYIGAEWDMIIPTQDAGLVPVTVYRELDRSMRLVVGPQIVAPELVELQQDLLSTRHGIGPLRRGDRDWGPMDLVFLDRALALLEPPERAILAAMPFVRAARAPQGGHSRFTTTARYVSADKEAHIEIYDAIRRGVTSEFCGDPRRPQLAGSMTILHEVGHALSAAAQLGLLRKENAAVDAYNAQVSRLNAKLSEPKEAQRLQAELYAQGKALDALRARLVEERRRQTVLTAYLARRGPTAGPTEYGRTDGEESFAESFALFHVDPPALRRIYPEVHAWFASGGHLAALAAASAPAQQIGGAQRASLAPRPR